MNRISVALVVLSALTACQKAADEDKTQPPIVAPSTSESASDKQLASPRSAPDDAADGEDREVAYRIVRAKVYRTDQTIEILVPEDIDVESRRLIEYKQGEDGKYYLVSLIPQ